MIRVVSGFSPSGYEEYGKRFLETFHKHWPKDIDLVVYTEAEVPMPRGECRSLWRCEGAAEFLARHKDNQERTGRKPNALWKPRYIGKPYNFRMDAVKFFRQCMIPEHAGADLRENDFLVWLDADVVTFSDTPKELISRLLGESDIAYLGRQGTHSEIGFWAVRINKRTREFLRMFAWLWRSDKVFELTEWHSAFVFDWCRKRVVMSENNLTPGGRGHVWHQSPLRHYTDHLKGQRKVLGFSPERNA